MAQFIIPIKIHKQHTKGITLIELLLYMSIFVILVLGVLQASLYLQNILQYNAAEYSAQQDIYKQLELIQQYLVQATKVEVGSSSLRIYSQNGYVEQKLQEGRLHMTYVYTRKKSLDISVYPYMYFKQFTFLKSPYSDTLFTKSVLLADIERIDSRKKSQKILEYLVVQTVDF